MHQRNLNARSEDARRRIQGAARALADALGIEPPRLLTAQEQRDGDVRVMRELEEVAALLERVAAQLVEA